MRQHLEDSIADGMTLRRYLKLQSDVGTLGGNITLADKDGVIWAADAGGSSRNVTLPARTDANDGTVRIIVNLSTAGENLVIKNSAATTLLTLPASGVALVLATGTVEAPGTQAWIAVPIGGEDLALADDAVISGDLTVAQVVSLSSTLSVAKQASFISNMIVDSVLALNSTLTVAKQGSFTSNIVAASTVDMQAVASIKTPTLGKATSDVVSYFGGTGSSQRASSNQASSNAATSASFGATQLAILQEIMNTLTAMSAWKGAA